MTTRPTTRSRSVVNALVAVVTCALLAACVQMPTSGPVVEPPVTTGADDVPGISFDPRPPQAGDSPVDIVSGFLEAMKATPISQTVALQFLSREAAETWAPEQQVMTYSDLGTVVGDMTVQVPLADVSLYDARGAWQRTQPAGQLVLGMVQEDGEWRISEVPNALIVPDSWFDDWYQRVSLYYFDPSAQVLVPEPVHVPRGEQLASSLVRGLLTPPSGELQDVAVTYFPPDTDLELSVPIESGIAQVALSGDPDAVDATTADLMRAQLAWTLRQEERINAVQLSIGDRAFNGSGGSTQVRLNVGSAYDPTGDPSSPDLFALDRNRVVSGTIGAFEETSGPLGQPGYALRGIGVSIDGSRVAAVSRTGSDLFVAPTESPTGEVTRPVVGGVDLADPHWDVRDRTWVLDRNAGRARVIVVVDGSARIVAVPGISGRAVTDLLVSRDGTRLVALVRGRTSDQVVSSRIRHDPSGAILGFSSLRTLWLPDEGSPRIRDIAWRSTTAISVLRDITAGSQVNTISVDGAPGEITTGGNTRLRGPNRLLVSSPVEGGEVYALAGRAVLSLTTPERAVPDLPRGLTSLTYVG
ncbi:LpqB family beta-propeller domain-containing protein [Nocardioides sp. S-58]|uniref:LpqB family beta-propeller domain-containing protein n=1 Tax=Nocardioides renjunii TaxID=3095075 RepID=A0ABU5KD40_9ACTN|nr:LpqB family beta-propeller domain-containing protein [Nocardioides sp. S-58]MDZ5662779.1 LpqB family beta-propeller domain-containing protein [Nocardioides sp. S-58]